MTVVIVQCRLSSTRLPQKAIKDLGGKPVLAWVLNSMKKVTADDYYLATDEDSASELEPIAKTCGWKLFIGSRDDVLARFCMLIESIKADVVIRATADNPFLFYEAAQALVEEYKRSEKQGACDYITWTGLPHGSGIEMFNAHSLLKARTLTQDPYDHEHVGPALYNHKETFTSIFRDAPSRWNFPKLRTTIDTLYDYIRAQLIVQEISQGKALEPNKKGSLLEPYTTEQIVSAFSNPIVKNMILCVPSVKKGRGTGHLHRCLSIVKQTNAIIYIPENADLSEKDSLIAEAIDSGLKPWQIVSKLPLKNEVGVIFTDAFSLESDFAKTLYQLAPVVSLDEGSSNTKYCDYLLDVIPGIEENKKVNLTQPKFIELPKSVKTKRECKDFSQIESVLVVAGGEDPANLAIPVSLVFAKLGKQVTAIHSQAAVLQSQIPFELTDKITLSDPIPNLREQLFKYDLVVTHYGLTAYEAMYAGCAVLLMGTTLLHVQLAQKYGFACLKDSSVTENSVKNVVADTQKLYPSCEIFKDAESQTLAGFVKNLSQSQKLCCPVCESESETPDVIVARSNQRTFRRCSTCGMLYMSFTTSADTEYTKTYFFDQYKNQYGKTYLEDFATIKAQCVRRTSVIDFIYHKKISSPMSHSVTPSILDIGCAYGPFLSAASDSGWQVFGTDVSKDAVDYVQKTLMFPAAVSAFPNFNPSVEFGVHLFDAVTMWYVIEHFKNLKDVLEGVSSILRPGGIFAFSTPSASGVSAHFNKETFFEQSPSDHFTLWEPSRVQAIVERFGFKVVKIVSTGHHPERFPTVKSHDWQKNSIPYTLFSVASHCFNLGDTFEVYCKKISAN